MLAIAYNLSPYLTRYLEKIELSRQQIILFPLSPRRELSAQFQTTINRVHFGFELTGQTLKPETIKTILSNQIVFATQKHPESYGKMQIDIIKYKEALDYIKRDWLLNAETITTATLHKIYSFTHDVQVLPHEKHMHEILDYLQSSTDNPFILAALAKLLFRSILAPSEQNEVFSTLCSYLFLYRSGMDCRGLLLLEKAWSDDKRIFFGQYQTALSKPNITSWLEYNIKLFSLQLDMTLQELTQTITKPEQDKIGKLNERQKTIMTLLEDPNAIITNRTVQKIFHISQITASRDLSKLTMLGLLFTQGKGRSVRYTRI